ncbi:pyruvate phosphate dikinase [Hasllibacter halocynthiae]|uniref:Pyruvate, phosphate dikinase n=1 Tax=Hasllibacter halocynthiae TaxID=595589 RepID=A0A2T0X6A5_9RHOB|nr:putative PEP-binding protein [Hasllibacter halocynthiae]PRY94490.1 pyruvate phosphate dikinase [Hasllibacter halocynthiae]
MQHDTPDAQPFVLVTQTARIDAARHGGRAKCLQRLVRLGLPVPTTVALPFDTVIMIARGEMPDMGALLAHFGPGAVLSVRPSSQDPDWGGPGTVLNIGLNPAVEAALAAKLGPEAAATLHLRLVETYATQVARLDPEPFADAGTPAAARAAYADEAGEPFPDDPATQLAGVLRSMARAWESTSARLLRQAHGAPEDAGLGLVVQAMALGLGPGASGAGVVQFADPTTGDPEVTGRYLPQSQGRAALQAPEALFVRSDPRGPALEDTCPEAVEALVAHGATCRTGLREEMQIEFTLSSGQLSVIDAVRAPRTERAAVRIAVALAEDGVIPRPAALLRVEPQAISHLLHRSIDPAAVRDRVARGVPASPGAATGRLVFTAEAAQQLEARGDAAILARRETAPEDVRGMHACAAILTERGGTTSHAAVIARGLGLPCVVGMRDVRVDPARRTLTAGGRVLAEGAVVTLDGAGGELLAGAPQLLDPAPGDGAQTLLAWADDARDIGVRANADTAQDALNAMAFGAEGVGLCRSEHMMFEAGRLALLRELIFAEEDAERDAALSRLLPLQRRDMRAVFEATAPRPVCIRLFDPPLHEFLPATREGLLEMAEALGRPVSEVERRIAGIEEVNPMLGMRGVRLAVAFPRITGMQARAAFEAAAGARAAGHDVPPPEIMIPLVTARREVELVRARIEEVAAALRAETGQDVPFRLGCMVETPRAALRAGEIAPLCDFLSFGTNDLTQMTYGLSRDDAGRFMSEYVNQGVWQEDPFRTLDRSGVGELLSIAAERARAAKPGIPLSVCGEHGGDIDSIAFCREQGFDAVSCSPFRVPMARLAAAQLTLLNPKQGI